MAIWELNLYNLRGLLWPCLWENGRLILLIVLRLYAFFEENAIKNGTLNINRAFFIFLPNIIL